jgi:hypothetical protein
MGSLIPALIALVFVLQDGGWRSSSPQVAIESGASAVTFRNTGSEGVDLWRPADTATSGSYVVRATLHKLAGRRREGYGLIFGGHGLGTEAARYSYVMLRGDGALLVKRRDGSATPVVRDWTPHAAIRPDDAEGRAQNVLEIRVTPRDVAISVNGAAVATVPATGLATAGVIGLRISHSVQLEVRDLSVSPVR